MEPFTMMALGGGAASIGGGVAKMFGGQSEAKAAQKAAQMYIDYQNREREEVPRGYQVDPRTSHDLTGKERPDMPTTIRCAA